MAAFDQNVFTPTLTRAPTALSGGGGAAGSSSTAAQPHVGLIGLVVVSVLVLFLLDRAGFRFAVTVGKR